MQCCSSVLQTEGQQSHHSCAPVATFLTGGNQIRPWIKAWKQSSSYQDCNLTKQGQPLQAPSMDMALLMPAARPGVTRYSQPVLSLQSGKVAPGHWGQRLQVLPVARCCSGRPDRLLCCTDRRCCPRLCTWACLKLSRRCHTVLLLGQAAVLVSHGGLGTPVRGKFEEGGVWDRFWGGGQAGLREAGGIEGGILNGSRESGTRGLAGRGLWGGLCRPEEAAAGGLAGRSLGAGLGGGCAEQSAVLPAGCQA